MADETRKLTPANENPWYVLMTLYGEQGDEERWDDGEAAEKNRWAWNAWATQHFSIEELEGAGIDTREFGAWDRHKAEYEERFFEALGERGGFDPTGISLPDPNETVYLSDLRFSKVLDISKYVFPSSIVMMNSVFEKVVIFDEVICLGKFRCSGVAFYETAYFDQAVFLSTVNFSDTRFEVAASFSEIKVASRSYFSQAVFKGHASFLFARFSNGLNFAGAKFASGSLFRNMSVWGDVEFSTCEFTGRTDFAEAKFLIAKKARENRVRFAGAGFNGPVSFRQTVFGSGYPDFDGAILHDVMTFTAKDQFWPKGEVLNVEQAKESCAKIRHAIAKQGLPEEEHFFFRREMHFASQIGGWWRRFPYRVFGVFSNYGESIGRPALSLLVLWAVPALALMIYFSWLDVMGETDWTGFHALGLSFANIFTFFGFHRVYFDLDMVRALPGPLQIMAAAQTVLALPLLFFLGLALRKRFRLR